MYKEEGMACHKVCKQGRDDMKVKIVYKAPSLHFYRDGRGFAYDLHFYIIPLYIV